MSILFSPAGKRQSPVKQRPQIILTLLFSVSLFYMECVVKFHCFGRITGHGFLFTFLLTVPIALTAALICHLLPSRWNRLGAAILLGAATAWYMAQVVYETVFQTFLVVDSLSMAGQAAQYWREALTGIGKSLPILLLLAVPLILLCTLGRHLPVAHRSSRFLVSMAVGAAILQLLAVGTIFHADQGILSPSALYRENFIPELSVSNFGVLTTLRLDLQNLLVQDVPPEAPSLPAEKPPEVPPPPEEPNYEANILSLDLALLAENAPDDAIRALHNYVQGRTPTQQNQYTGRFQGKNLIFLTGEGFWRYAVDEKLTPTLWKLAHEGFVFSNFYNPLWWKSTTDGEYAACTGMIPNESFRAFRVSGSNSMPFCMGNQLRAKGYPTTAYHNHTYDYYNRDLSHPNMGYDYYAVGQGLQVKSTWPESDLEMMEQTIPQALAGETPFHLYYMTVSGHLNYNFTGNAMAYKHREEAQAAYPDHSEAFQAYLACNMELDLAMEYLLEQLEAAGELENTVICLSGDHYPYGLLPEQLDELAGKALDPDFERYHSTLILWSGDMDKAVTVDKPCDSLDILPTLLNLFGLPYDSRMLAGRDILADEPGLVIFSNRSFLTEQGRYNARTDEFLPSDPSAPVPENDVQETFRQVKDLFWFSEQVLKTDYYSQLNLT